MKLVQTWYRSARSVTVQVFSITFVVLAGLAGATAWALDPGLPPGSNFDLSHWYLGLPVDSSGGTSGTSASISAATLTNGYTSEWFYTGPDGAMVFWAWVVGATTSGSSYPRSELREQLSPPNNSVNWIPCGTHILNAQCKVLQVPSTPKVIIGQIHAYSSAALPTVKIYYNDGAAYGMVKTNSTDDASDLTFPSVSVGLSNSITYQIKVVNGLISIAINGVTNSLNIFQTDPNYTNETQYFKAGSYCQDNTGTPDEGARVAFYAVSLFHAPSIASQPASRGATIGSNVTFTVSAFGNGTLTYQWWLNETNILSGATSDSLTITNVSSADAGNYTVVVDDSLGSVTSAVARLSVTSETYRETFSTPGSINWTCPDGVTSVQVECWGGGGAGGSAKRDPDSNSTEYGGGGAGGAYARSDSVSVTPGLIYNIAVGAGGANNSSVNDTTVPGDDSSFSYGTTTNCLAKGGAGGESAVGNSATTRYGVGGTGTATGSIGDFVYAGGSGATGAASSAGGGGSSAGTNSDGTAAISNVGATAPSGGGNGGTGPTTTSTSGGTGSAPGGGGSGARSGSYALRAGGTGGAGQVVLTYTVYLNMPPPLTLSIPLSATEGDGVLTNQGIITISSAPANDVVVTLNSSNTNKVVVPLSVTILAGQTNATFDVTIIDNALLDGTQTAAITGAANDFSDGTATIAVYDNETASLTVTVPPSAVEGQGVLTNAGTVFVSAPVAENVKVGLTSSDTTEAIVPSTVTILTGQTAAAFNVTIVNDNQIDGPQPATITAHVANWTDGSAAIVVQDNENTNLTVSLPASAYEGSGVLTNAGHVSISGTWPSDILVNLTSDNPDKVLVPATVTIPAGQTSTVFNVTIVDNATPDGTQIATVAATATGFVDSSANIAVKDNDVYQFGMSNIASPQSAGTPFAVSIVALDINSSTITVYQTAINLTGSGDGGSDSVQPATITTWTNGVWTGAVRVNTIDTNVRLTADDGAGHTGLSNPFNVQLGSLDHFAWNIVPSPQYKDTPFPVNVIAQDAGNNTITGFTGAVALSGLTNGISTNTILGNVAGTSWGSGGYTLGYSFTPNADLTVTHVRHFFGTRVSIWTDAGSLLVAQSVTSTQDTWVETALPTPVKLLSNTTYRVGAYTGGGAYCSGSGGGSDFPDGTINQDYWSSGAAFPTQVLGWPRWWFVDLRYTVDVGAPVSVTPTNSGNFVSGVWSGAVTVLQTATNMVLAANDGASHFGTSDVFTVIRRGVLAVTPASVFSASGPVGGPFSPSSQVYTLTNSGGASLSWSASNGQSWLSLSATNGTLPVGGSATVTVLINSLANSLAIDSYSDSVTFTNLTNGTGATTLPVTLTVFNPLLPPAAPSGLAANVVSINQINLSWTDNSPNEDGFKIERSTDGTNFLQIAQVLPNTTSYRNTALWPGATYYYRVRAFNYVGPSDFSNVASANTPVMCLPAVVGWGDNSYGQATPPAGLSNVVAIAAGYHHSVALKSDGTVLGWGDNSYGQRDPPAGLSNVVAIAADAYHSLALKGDGTVVGWGNNSYGQRDPPAGLSNVVAIAAGYYYHSLALKGDGTVVGWGYNAYGQATPPAGLSGAVAIAAGGYDSLALKSDGTVLGWGDNSYGQRDPPAGLSNVVAIAAGYRHSVALKSDGTVLGWGDNAYGQATPPAGLSGAVAITTGYYHSLALKGDGTVVGWGYNGYGQATPPAGLSNAVAIAGGFVHSLALTSLCPPNAPFGLTATAVSSSQINLSWIDNSSSEAGFKVERAPDNGGSPGAWAQIATVGANISTYSNTGLSPNTKYWYRVRAYIAGSNSPYSNEAGATTLPLPPSVPSGLTATAVSASQINLSWMDNSTNEDGFRIERAISSGGPWSENGSVSSNVTAYPDTGVTCGQTYFYRVRAYNAGGLSSYSNTDGAATGTIDTDGDGIPDCWMLQYFGHPTGQAGDSSRAQDDADGDGFTNLQEFLAGTDSTNNTSYWRIQASPANGLAPLTVSFTENSSGSSITNRLWNFGDGRTSSETSPSHIYTNAGTFSVGLTIFNLSGTETLIASNLITVSPFAVWTNANASGNWSEATSWNPVVIPDNGASVIFGAAGITAMLDNVSRTVGHIGFYRSADFFVSATGGANLTITNGITVASNVASDFTYTVSAPLLLGGANIWSMIGNGTLQITAPVSGANPITKTGSGTLILSGTNTFSGEMTVSNGVLKVVGTGLITNTASIDIASGATLDVSGRTSGSMMLVSGQTLQGNGTILGKLIMANGSTLSPSGNSVGMLTFLNDLVVSNTATLQYDLGTNSDLTAVTSNLTLGGILNINDAGGFGPGVYTLVTYGGALTYNGLTIGTTPNTNFLYVIDTNTVGAVKLDVMPSPTTILADAGNLFDKFGTLAPSNSVAVLVADTGTDGFVDPQPGFPLNLGAAWGADDKVVGLWDLTAIAADYGDGQLYDQTVVAYTNGIAPGQRLQLYWFPSLTLASNTLGVTSYGKYTDPIGIDGSDVWHMPAGGSSVHLKFWTEFWGGSNPETAGLATFSTTGVAPVAGFTASPTSGTEPLEVTFTDTSSGSPLPSLFWNLGDSTTLNTSAGASFPHTYAAGTYTVTLIASNSAGTSALVSNNLITVITAFQAWQLSRFGCTNCAQAAGGADPDGDGMSNTNEFLAGTDPTSSASALRIISAVRQATDVVIVWTTAGGFTNAVQATAGSEDGGYTTNFIDFSGPIIISGSGDATTNYVDVGAITNVPSRHYRIRLVQ